jgi:hypothetical protein
MLIAEMRPLAAGCGRNLFVGDSITYGGGSIAEEELFCRIAEQRLIAEGKNVDIVNLSAPGWSPRNWIRDIERHGLHEADVVVLVLPQCDLARPFATRELAGHESTSKLSSLFAIHESEEPLLVVGFHVGVDAVDGAFVN